MKAMFEGTADELATVVMLFASGNGSTLTKEIFMHSMQELSDQIKADKDAVINYIATRDAADAALQTRLTEALATVATDEAQLVALTAQVDAAFADAKVIADTVNPPPVQTTPPDSTSDAGNSDGGTGGSAEPSDGSSSDAGGSGGEVAVDPTLGGDASGAGSSADTTQ